MTTVTTIVLVCDSSEAYAADGSIEPGPILLAQAWLDERGWGALSLLKGAGPYAASVDIWASDFNRIGGDAKSFGDYVASLEWSFPESVVLTVQPEEGDTLVFRPLFAPSDIWRT